MGFSRQEYWGGLPGPMPGDLLDPGIDPTCNFCDSCLGRWIFTTASLGNPSLYSLLFFLLIHGPGHACNTKIPMLILPSSWEEHYQQFLSALSAIQFINLYLYTHTHTHTMYIMCMCVCVYTHSWPLNNKGLGYWPSYLKIWVQLTFHWSYIDV